MPSLKTVLAVLSMAVAATAVPISVETEIVDASTVEFQAPAGFEVDSSIEARADLDLDVEAEAEADAEVDIEFGAAADIEARSVDVEADADINTDISITPRAASGSVTWFHPGLGACGGRNKDSDYITAVSDKLYDSYKPKSPCGRKIKLTHKNKSITVTVVDRCVGCAYNNLDLSPRAFADLFGATSIGLVHNVKWDWA